MKIILNGNDDVCNNSEQIRFENLLKEGREYKSEKKKCQTFK